MGATAIEDRLQDGVPDAISTLLSVSVLYTTILIMLSTLLLSQVGIHLTLIYL